MILIMDEENPASPEEKSPMIELSEQDYQPLETFELVWRWTDTRWNLLPEDALANIRPLHRDKAGEIHRRILELNPNNDPEHGFVPGRYEFADRIDTADKDMQQVRNWLQHYIPDLTQPVIVSWNSNNAVVTTGAIFCEFWDDFCYARSDDAGVLPLTEDWMLFWWHEEAFYFGRPYSA